MEKTKQLKEYRTPELRIVLREESNIVFFVASGSPITAGINKMTKNTSTSW